VAAKRSDKAGRRLVAPIVLLVVVAVAAVVWILRMGSAITEEEARAIVDSGELIGLTVPEALTRLQHKPLDSVDEIVVLDFTHIPGWSYGSLALDVENGRVTSAQWVARSTSSAPPITRRAAPR